MGGASRVDDDHDVADSLGVLLRVVLAYDVCVAYSGESATEIAGEYRPDIVILDLNMPGLDGCQTVRALESDRRLLRATFVAHAAAADPFVERLAVRIGFARFIAKGGAASVSTLIDVLGEVKRSRRGRRVG